MLKNNTVNIVFILVLVTLMVWDLYGEISLWLYVLAVILYSIIQAYGSSVLSAEFFVPVISSASSSANAIALTFDDGPITGKTERVLEILKAKKVTAAFFCIGRRIDENPSLLKRTFEEGHVLGNHSYWHSRTFDLQSSSKVLDELKKTDAAIQTTCGVTPVFFRPPYGVTNPMIAGALRQSQHKVVGWSIRSFDTVIKDPEKLMMRITRPLKSGDIVLFHDFSDTMLEILPEFIDHVHKIGLKIVRLDQLLNEKPYVD